MKYLYFTIFLFISLFISGCDLLDDSPCGPKETLDIYLLGSSIVDTAGGVFNHYTEGGNIVFQWSELVENVCAEEHVKANARVALLDETTTGISARANISWQFLFEEKITMTKTGSDIKGNGEAGLKQVFDKEPGWFVAAVEVYFPSKGSFALDTAFLKKNVISVELMANYRKH